MGHLVCLAVACWPFLYLIERTPADIWLSVFGIAFILRSFRSVNGAGCRRSGSGLLFFSAVALLASPFPKILSIRLAKRLPGSDFRFTPPPVCSGWNQPGPAEYDVCGNGVATAIMAVVLAVELGSAFIVLDSPGAAIWSLWRPVLVIFLARQ